MSRICSICGKKPLSGNNRSHSNRASKRRFGVNIQKIRYRLNGKVKRGYVCTSCLKKVEKIA
ncbi:MAG: 50S ribosomal protein L28 [Elusimicrobia bacterium]|nr:50S ribosomal protein L28 [Elusimicrobiota bacterium]